MLTTRINWQNKFFEQMADAIIVDKVGSDAQLGQLGIWIGKNTITNGFESSLTNSVVAHINELNRAVDF